MKNVISQQVRVHIVLVLLIMGAPFFFFGGIDYHSAKFTASWDLGHVLFFALVSWLLCLVVRDHFPKLSGFTTQLVVFFIVLVLGLTIEGVQMKVDGRNADLYDVLRNQLGCLIALAFSCAEKPKKGKWLSIYRGVVILLVFFVLYPLTRVISGEILAVYNFPILADFETILEVDRWHSKKQMLIQKEIVRHGRHALKVKMTTDIYSWVSLADFSGNWDGFSKLFISVYLPDEGELDLICHIQDSDSGNCYKDYFKRRFTLKNGWNDLVIPLVDVKNGSDNRLLNMEQIVSLTFVVVRQKKERVLYFDNIYLE